MGETQPGPALVSYRDGVTELIDAGEPFGVVEDAIDTSAGLTEDPRAVLRMRASRWNGRGGPVTQQGDGPSSASGERARAEASVERARAERYKLRQRDIRREAGAGHGRARPSEFRGERPSIPRLASGFVKRVGGLINGK